MAVSRPHRTTAESASGARAAMAGTWTLHIETGDGEGLDTPTRVLELGTTPIRVGRGIHCEVRLNQVGLGDIQCMIRRRGDEWHFQPIGPPGRIWIDGRPADNQRPLPVGAALRVGRATLTIHASSPNLREPGSFDAPITIDAEPVGTTPVEPVAELAAAATTPPEPEAIHPSPPDAASDNPGDDRAKRWQTRLEQRDQWLKDRQSEKRWEARWKAAGETLRARSTPPPAAPATPPPPSPVPEAVPPPFVARPVVDRAPIVRRVEPRPVFGHTRRVPEVAPKPEPQRVPLRPPLAEPPSTGAARPEPVATPAPTLRADATARIVPDEILDPPPPPAIQPPADDFDRVESVLAELSLIPAPPTALASDPAEAARPLAPSISTGDQADRGVTDSATLEALGPPAGFVPPEAREVAEIAASPAVAPLPPQPEPIPAPTPLVEFVPPPLAIAPEPAVAPVDPIEPQAPAAVAPPRPKRARPTLKLKAPVEPRPAGTSPPRVRPPLIAPDDDPAVWAAEIHPEADIAPALSQLTRTDREPDRRGNHRESTRPGPQSKAAAPGSKEYPSARSIFAAQGTRAAGPAVESALEPVRTRRVPEPTESLRPDGWSIPFALGWLPAVALVLACGTFAVGLAVVWLEDASSGGIAIRLATRAESARSPVVDAQAIPKSAWWQTTASHLAAWALTMERVGNGEDRSADARVLEADARSVSPLGARARFVSEPVPGQEADASASIRLGPTRDVVTLTAMGHRLCRANQRADAVRAYRTAFLLAATTARSTLSRPTFRADPQINRYALPHSSLLDPIARDMVAAGDWTAEEWTEATPEFGPALLAVAAAVREKDPADAERRLEAVCQGINRPLDPRFEAAEHQASIAEALAERGRWTDAVAQYRLAIDGETRDLDRRVWWLNLAEVARKSGDDSLRNQAIESAKGTDLSDEVTQRAANAHKNAPEPGLSAQNR